MRILATSVFVFSVSVAAWAFDVPEKSVVLGGYDKESFTGRLHAKAADRMEGLWYYPDERITLAIERIAAGGNENRMVYRIVVVDSEDCAVDCGSVMGYMEKTAAWNQFKLWLYSGVTDDTLVYPVKCVAEVDKDFSTLMIDRPDVKLKFSVNLARFLPSIFGGVRIYPKFDKPSTKPGFRRVDFGDSDLTPIYF